MNGAKNGSAIRRRARLEAWADPEEERSRLTREALAEVDAGRVIDQQAVQAWADTLGTETALPVPR